MTHEHIDHTAGALELCRRFKVPLHVPSGAAIPGQTRRVSEGERIAFGEAAFTALYVPGHHSFPYPTESLYGNIAWYCEEAGILFTGDTLFPCGYGFVAAGFERPMFESLKRLRSLPEETQLFFGHEYALRTTAAAARLDRDNAALRHRLSEIRELARNRQPAIPTTLRHEITVSPWLRWDDETFKKKLGIAESDGFVSFMRIKERWEEL
jgi:hydroxyacylglutathione hydrolase